MYVPMGGNDKAVRNAINDLPKTLHDTYIRILQKVESNNSEDIERVQHLLKWLVFGVRNLTLDELAECVSVDISDRGGSFDFDGVFTDGEDVVELCGSLVTLSSDGYVALAYYTVKAFSSVCLTYLTHDNFAGTRERSGKASLQTFDDDVSDELFNLIMRLLESDADSGGNHRARCHMFFYRQKSSGQRLKTSSNSPLYFASFFGFPGAVSDLLDDNTHIHTEEPMKANASAGHESVIEVFLGQCEWIDISVFEKCLYMAAT
ncbi:hypothetical protein N7491_004278 [Penicillium cf. griseofulvum]|nr:hypothetical protein N7491_004278 [Penicillium cf. griseofulvum]